MPAPMKSVRRPSLSWEAESESARDDRPRVALPLRGALELAEAFRPLIDRSIDDRDRFGDETRRDETAGVDREGSCEGGLG